MAVFSLDVKIKIIPYGTKIIYHGENGWKHTKCFCGNYNKGDNTYGIYKGWDVSHVPVQSIEIYDW